MRSPNAKRTRCAQALAGVTIAIMACTSYGADWIVSGKAGAIFVNGSRGAIVREDALLAALDSGHLRAAALDVFAVEPLAQDSPLRTHPKVTPFPHIGSATHEMRREMAELATGNLLRVLDGDAAISAFDLSKA